MLFAYLDLCQDEPGAGNVWPKKYRKNEIALVKTEKKKKEEKKLDLAQAEGFKGKVLKSFQTSITSVALCSVLLKTVLGSAEWASII